MPDSRPRKFSATRSAVRIDAGAAGQLGDEAGLAPLALRGVGVPAQLGVDALEHLLRHAQAGDHARAPSADARAPGAPGSAPPRGREVALAEVLGEGAVDQLQHQAAAGSRSRAMPAAA